MKTRGVSAEPPDRARSAQTLSRPHPTPRRGMGRTTLAGFNQVGREATGRSCLCTCSSSKASWRRACKNTPPLECTLVLPGGGLATRTATRTALLLGTAPRPAKSWLRWSSDSRGLLADLYNPRQDEDLACYYGLKKSFSGRSTTWVLSRSSLARERADAQWSFCLPAGWAEEYGAAGSWKFKTSKGGTPVSMSLSWRFRGSPGRPQARQEQERRVHHGSGQPSLG
ncbi:unnamed protein product [Pylaiella littoralis]